MKFYLYDRLSGREVGDLVDPEAVILIPLAAPENHGPHLPMGTDLYLAESLAQMAAERFTVRRPNSNIFLYPGIAIGGATISETGSVKVRSKDLARCLSFLGKRLVRQGFRRIIFLSAHGAPPHVNAMDKAARYVNGLIQGKNQGGGALAPYSRLMGNIYAGLHVNQWRSRGIDLPENILSLLEQDIHGGWLETSMMLAARPDLMDDSYKTTPDILPPKRSWLDKVEKLILWIFDRAGMSDQLKLEGRTGLRLGKNDFSWILRGRSEGYCGRPFLATAELGRAVMDALADDIAESMEQVFVQGVSPSAYKSAGYWFNWIKRVGVFSACLILVFFLFQWLG